MSKTFCSIPWIHLATHPNGECTLCCQSEMKDHLSTAQNNNGDILTLNKNSIEQIINSDRFNEVRLSMLEGKEHPACDTCYRLEKNGGISKRMYEEKRFKFSIDNARQITREDGSINIDFQYIELRLGNLCNLKCITCNPNSSSKWMPDFIELKDNYNFKFDHDFSGCTPDMYEWPDMDSFWKDLEKNSSSLKRIFINGGEPTLIKKHWAFLERLIKLGKAKDIELLYSINMTYLPPQAKKLWAEFGHVILQASIDDLDERNRYIRYPADWKKTLELFETILDFGHEVCALQTISCFNLLYAGDFYKFFSQYSKMAYVAYNFVVHPGYFSPFVLRPEVRSEILARLKGELPSEKFRQLEDHYSNQRFDEEEWRRFRHIVPATDEIRGTQFSKIFPELHEILGKHGQNL